MSVETIGGSTDDRPLRQSSLPALYVPSGMPEPPPKLKDAAYYIVNLIWEGQLLRAKDAEGFITLNAVDLRKVFREEKQAIGWLMGEGIIDRNQYIPGIKSYGYRLKHGLDPVRQIVPSPRLTKKLKGKEQKKLGGLAPVHAHLYHWLDHVKIDLKEVELSLTTTENQKRKQLLGPVRLIASGVRPFKVCDFGRVHTSITQLGKILRPCLTIDEKRLVSLDISNSQPLILAHMVKQAMQAKDGISKKTRPLNKKHCLTTLNRNNCPSLSNSLYPSGFFSLGINGGTHQPLYRNSCLSRSNPLQSPGFFSLGINGGTHQCYPCASMINTDTGMVTQGSRGLGIGGCYSGINTDRLGMYPILHNDAQSDLRPYKTSPFCSEESGASCIKPDLSVFIKQCEAGTFYEYLMGLAGIPNTPQKRRKFKKDFFKHVLYGPRRLKRRPWDGISPKRGGKRRRIVVTELFKREFPTVWEFIDNAKKKNYRHFSHRMQRAESHLMIRGVCGRLMKEHPHIPVLTIHDSILTPAEHVETVTRIIKEVFNLKGINPKISLEG